MDLRCRKLDCKFNDRHTCTAKGLVVSKTTTCKTYQKDESKIVVKQSMFEGTPNFAPQRDCKALTIKCSAACLLNKDGVCEANGITINQTRNKVYCQTFINK